MALKVGFVGLGSMGKPIAVNVARGGFDLMVYDLREEPLRELAALGAKIAGSAKEVAQHAEIIEITVVDDAQVEEVVLGANGLLQEARPGTIIAIHSTIHPDTVRKVAARAKEKGVGVIDAQLSGGGIGAEAKSLSFMVGGDKAYLEKCRPVFETSGAKIFHMGELGAGAITKAAHQAIVVGTMMSVAEAMRLVEKAGLNPRAFEEVVNASAARSFIADEWLDFFRFLDAKKGILHKSVDPALELAYGLDLPMPLIAHAQQLLPLYLLGPKGR